MKKIKWSDVIAYVIAIIMAEVFGYLIFQDLIFALLFGVLVFCYLRLIDSAEDKCPDEVYVVYYDEKES